MTLGKPLHIHCSGLLGDRALMSWYNSFTWKVVLKSDTLVTLGKNLLSMLIVRVFQEKELQVNRIVLRGRWSLNATHL